MKRTIGMLTAALALAGAAAGVAVAASSPSVSTGAATGIADTSAVIHGTVNPNGASTSYQFQWGLTNAYGLSSGNHSAGHGTKNVSVQTTATGLIPGTVYHYRLVALSKSGGTLGADRTFKTSGHPPPGVATGPSTLLGKTVATLTGTVNPNGEATTWAFQYGLSPSYGVETFGQTLPAGSVPVTVSVQLQGLAPGTTFHYRLVALHGASVFSSGADATFMTLPSPRYVPRVRATTTPSRAKSKPYAFTTFGTVAGPSFIPASLDCTGDATVRFFLGRKRVSSSVAPLQPNCTFASQTSFKRLFGRVSRELRISIQFDGNGYLAPASARTEHVRLG